MRSLSHPVMLSFAFFSKKLRILKNNVNDCFIVGFTYPALGVISSTIYLHFNVVSSNALALSTRKEPFGFSL